MNESNNIDEVNEVDTSQMFYCKYCYRNVTVSVGDGIWVCDNCDHGLALLIEPKMLTLADCIELDEDEMTFCSYCNDDVNVDISEEREIYTCDRCGRGLGPFESSEGLTYCGYCNKNVTVSAGDGIYVCDQCGCGLSPLKSSGE